MGSAVHLESSGCGSWLCVVVSHGQHARVRGHRVRVATSTAAAAGAVRRPARADAGAVTAARRGCVVCANRLDSSVVAPRALAPSLSLPLSSSSSSSSSFSSSPPSVPLFSSSLTSPSLSRAVELRRHVVHATEASFRRAPGWNGPFDRTVSRADAIRQCACSFVARLCQWLVACAGARCVTALLAVCVRSVGLRCGAP